MNEEQKHKSATKCLAYLSFKIEPDKKKFPPNGSECYGDWPPCREHGE